MHSSHSYARLRTSRFKLGAAVLLLGVAFTSAACGSDDSSDTSSVDSAGLEKATDFSKPFLSPPTSIGSDAKLTVAPESGKKVAYLACSLEPCLKQLDAAKQAADLLGWEVTTTSFEFTPEDILAKVQAAVDAKVDGIIVNGSSRALYATAADAAEEAGIPIVASSTDDEVAPPLVAVSGGLADFDRVGTVVGNFVISDSEAKANALVFELSDVPISVQLTKSAAQTINDGCTSCTAKVITTKAADIGTKLPSQVVSELQRNPKANYVLFGDASQATGVAAALREAGLDDKVRIAGANASPQSLANIENGSERAYVQFSTPYFAWQGFDALVRQFEGVPQVTDWEMPLQTLTQESIKGESQDDLLYELPRDMGDQFAALWDLDAS
jgi:ABC-type sugar transport system substrate-binding protein